MAEMSPARNPKEYMLFLTSFVEQSSEGIAIADLNGNLLYLNRAWAEMHGYESAEELNGRHLSIFHNSDQFENEVEPFNSKALKYGSSRGEINHIRKDGTAFQTLMTTTVLKDESGNPIAISGIAKDITSIKLVENELRNIEERFRAAFETTQDCILIWDENCNYLYANQAAIDHVGTTREKVIGKNISEGLSHMPDLMHLWKNRVKQVFKTGEHYHYQDRIHMQDKVSFTDSVVTPVLDHEGRVSAVCVVYRDITELKFTEKELRVTGERLRIAGQLAYDLIYEWNTETDTVDWFGDIDAILGYEKGTISRSIETWFDLIHPDDSANLKKSIELHKTSLEPIRSEYRIRHNDGTYRFWSDNALPLPSNDGKPCRWIGVCKDITERRRAEDSLRESEHRFRTLIQAAPVYFVMISPEGKTMMMNDAMLKALDYELTAVINTDYLDTFVPENERGEVSRVISRIVEKREATLNENHVICRNGAELMVEWHGRPVFKDNGELDYFFGVGTDITEHRKSLQEKSRLEQQLRQVQKLESIGRLAGGIAHDLNNLLSPILGYGEMLLNEKGEDDPDREPLNEIVDASVRARDLIRQLLAFSRRQTLNFRNINLNELLSDFEKLLRRTIREDISIAFSPASSLPLIEGDIGQLEQVVMNLAVNAQDAMPDGGELSIGTSAVDLDEYFTSKFEDLTPGQYVMLVVSDTGYGMEDEIREHLFEPFFTTKSKEMGTGLGLATVYGIVRQHNGCIMLYSEPGYGSTFKIYLPVSRKSSEPEIQVGITPRNLCGTETILIVEDNEQVKNLTIAIMKQRGYSVLDAENGNEALELLDSYDGPLHLLLTDVIMPGMNGRELYDRLIESYSGLKVLYMSGYSDNVIAHHGVIEAGVNFIQKPFSAQVLAAKVRKVLLN